MLQITKLTTAPLQTQTFVLPDGTSFTFTLYYRPNQLGWFFNTITYKSFTLNCLRVSIQPNMLFQFQNKIPFGIACLADNNREPTLQQDFSSGAARLYVLTADEVKQYSDFLKNGQ